MADEIYRQVKTVGLLFMLPIILGVWPLAGYFAGHYLAQRFGWPEYVSLVCAVVGFLAGILEMMRILKAMPKDKKSKD